MADIDTQIRALGEQVVAYGHCGLLIDPYLKEPAADALADIPESDCVAIPVKHPALEPHQRPRLIRIRDKAVHQLRASLTEAHREQTAPEREAREGLTIGGWLFSAAPIERVAYHLAQVMQRRMPHESRPRYIRWADPRVFSWLWLDLSPRQQIQLLGPIEAWWTLERSGQCRVYKTEAGSIDSEQVRGRLQLTAEQWQRAGQGEAVHAMVRAWQTLTPELTPDYLSQAVHILQDGYAAGARNAPDAITLGLYRLQIHPGLAWHPTVQACIRQANESQRPLGEYLDTIKDPEGWDRIRDELNPPQQPAAAR